MKKVLLVICAAGALTFLTGIPELAEGITARGWDGVNYGRVLFPLIISAASVWLLKKRQR